MNNKVRIIKDLFLNQTDYVALGTGNITIGQWSPPRPYHLATEDKLNDLLQAHVTGERMTVKKIDDSGWYDASVRVGSYSPDKHGTTKYLVFDIDGGKPKEGHSDPLKDPDACALFLMEELKKRGVYPYLEKSGSGTGWHVWVFFTQKQPADKVRLFAKDVIKAVPSELKLTYKGKIDNTIEIFPKQNFQKNYGNLIWLPWWHGSKNGGGLFYDELLDTIPMPRFVLSGLPYIAPEDNNKPIFEDQEKSEWNEWRRDALVRLNLETIYGKWLTGRERASGFLECRDPDSPTGDRNPSAGVYDGTDGEHERGWFHSFRTEESMDVFDFMVKHGMAENLGEAFYKIAQMTGTLDTYPKNKGKPEIILNATQWSDVVYLTWQAFLAHNRPPTFFHSGAGLVRLRKRPVLTVDIIGAKELNRDIPSIADFYKIGKKGIKTPATPPDRLGNDLIKYLEEGLPILERITHIPIFTRDGRLLIKPGFDEKSNIYHIPKKDFITIERSFDYKAAKKYIDYLLQDFSFATQSDKANYIAGILTPFVRDLITGPVPLIYIEAPTPGSGKSLLAKIMSIIITGGSDTFYPMEIRDRNGDEVRKVITSALKENPDLVVFDNVSGHLDSPSFALMLTQTRWRDRILGKNNVADLPNKAEWVITANNLSITEELVRRMIRVRLEPNSASPADRKNFTIKEPLDQFVRNTRSQLIWCFLSFIDEWFRRGKPEGKLRIGSFESWSAVMSGIFETIGIEGLAANQKQLVDSVNTEKSEWEVFLNLWWEKYRGEYVSAGQLVRLASDPTNPMLMYYRGTGDEQNQTLRMGQHLRRRRDKVYGKWKIRMGEYTRSKSRYWRLEPIEEVGEPIEEISEPFEEPADFY